MFALLLIVVPFQWVWGAAAPYCAHESGTSAKGHFGHHEHKHQTESESVAAGGGADDSKSAFHTDCEACHLGSSAFVPVVFQVVAALPPDGTAMHPSPDYDSHIPDSPLRPDRHPAYPAARFDGDVVVVFPAD